MRKHSPLFKTCPMKRTTKILSLRVHTVLWCGVAWALSTLSMSVQAQCTLACNDEVNISLPGPDEQCEAIIVPDMVLEDSTSCPGDYEITVMDANGFPIPSSPAVGAEYIGQQLLYSILHPDSGNSCWGYLNIEDKLPPTVYHCVDDTVYCVQDPTPIWEGGDAEAPWFDDCSQIVSQGYTDDVIVGNCTESYTQLIMRTWTAIDAQGYSNTCIQSITVARVSMAQYTPLCPDDVELECNGANPPLTDPAYTGYPVLFIDGQYYPIIPDAGGSCEVVSAYQDEVFQVCGGGYKILRTWSVYDWCLPQGGNVPNPWTCTQVIKVVDTTPPELACPAPVVEGTLSSSCTANVQLPPATVVDACSDFSVQIQSDYGVVDANGGWLYEVPIGTHTITYKATDDCGNFSLCSTTLTVVDDVEPVAVCDEFTTVSLTGDGTALVHASTFDDGSQDNCGIDYFEVRRMPDACWPAGTPFDERVSFGCCDIGQTVVVVLRVYDIYGNYNDCMVEVQVQDKIDPTIVCPPDKTVPCGTDLSDLGIFSYADYSDNCPNVTLSVDSVWDISSCNVGTIYRYFTATDAGGRTAQCTQVITVVNDDPFTIDDIQWPADYTTTNCAAPLEPQNLPSTPINYAMPITNESTCDLVAVTWSDQVLPIAPPACFKILRKWIVVDWCQFDPNNPTVGGYWEYTQVLKVTDHDAPVVTCPTDVVVSSIDADCVSDFVAIAPIEATDCSPELAYGFEVDLYNDGTFDQAGTGPDASGEYPFGQHKVVFTVSDGCGNQSSCEVNVTVADGKKPTPICVNGIAVDLMPDGNGGGIIQITPDLFDAGSYDNCTAAQDLKMWVTPDVFTCEEVGTNIVSMWVEDESGNADFCLTYVIVQDNMEVCSGDNPSIAGAIQTEQGQGVQDVHVQINAGAFGASTTTQADGTFQFTNLLPGSDYTVSPTLDTDPLNGVTSYDLVLIQKHILQIDPLDSPYQLIAADANNSGAITTADVVALRKLILFIEPSLPNNTSWRFVDAHYQFPDPANPWAEVFPEVYSVNNLTTDQLGVDFVAIKVGDVNGSASTNQWAASEDRSKSEVLQLSAISVPLVKGQEVRIPIVLATQADVSALQGTLQFDTDVLALEDIEPAGLPGMSSDHFGFTFMHEGLITWSWHQVQGVHLPKGTLLFVLRLRAKEDAAPAQWIDLGMRPTPSIAYDLDGNLLALEWTERGDGLQSNNKLYANRPNPFGQETFIGFELERAGTATLTVRDLQGRVVWQRTEMANKGYNEWRLQRDELPVAGVYTYQLQAGTFIATRRMLVVE